MIYEELQKRALPPIAPAEILTENRVEKWEMYRQSLIARLEECCYGRPYTLHCEVSSNVLSVSPMALGGKATERKVKLTINGENGEKAAFVITELLPHSEKPVPVFLWPQFEKSLDEGYKPIEEIIDSGFGIVSCFYQTIAMDSVQNDFGIFATTRENTWGKISKWAFGLSRIMDYIETVEDINSNRVALLGMSRLGKAVLWTAVQDTRFSLYVPALSGTGGVSLYRGNEKETVQQLVKNFPYWFCNDFAAQKYTATELPFDAHMLVALCAPRHLYICVGNQDEFVDYHNEFLACCAASGIYRLYRKEGIVTPDEWPALERPLQDGTIGFHVRRGTHFLSRYDWQQIINYRIKFSL